MVKYKDNRIYETNTMDALAEVVQLLDPTYEPMGFVCLTMICLGLAWL
jgi:hypothetical protein